LLTVSIKEVLFSSSGQMDIENNGNDNSNQSWCVEMEGIFGNVTEKKYFNCENN